MTASDLFGVVVRAMGLFLLVLGVLTFVSGLIKLLTATYPVPAEGGALLLSIVVIATGLFFLLGANWITRAIYGNRPN